MRDVEKVCPKAERKRLDRPGRRRQVGAGRPFALHLWDRVLLVLMYYRTYLIQDGMTHCSRSAGSISTNISKMAPTVWECLPIWRDVYEKARKCSTIEELNGVLPGLVALTDAAEQPTQQPRRSDTESHYSTKAKTHTIKAQYTTSFDGLIARKTVHSPSRWYHSKIFTMKHPTFPGNLPYGNEADSGKFRRGPPASLW